MIYYVIKDDGGRYWTGGTKLVRPPILIMSENIDEAKVSRASVVMERQIAKSQNPERYHVCEVDSREHKRLAD